MPPNKRRVTPGLPVNGDDPLQSLAADIAALAYSYWESEGRPADSHMRHWLRAESEVRQARGLPALESDPP